MPRTMLTFAVLASSIGCTTPRVLADRDRCHRVAKPGVEIVYCKPLDAPASVVEECRFETRKVDRICPGELFAPETPAEKAPPANGNGAP